MLNFNVTITGASGVGDAYSASRPGRLPRRDIGQTYLGIRDEVGMTVHAAVLACMEESSLSGVREATVVICVYRGYAWPTRAEVCRREFSMKNPAERTLAERAGEYRAVKEVAREVADLIHQGRGGSQMT